MTAFYNEFDKSAAAVVGQRFGKLMVVAVFSGSKDKHSTAQCECECGAVCTKRLTHLRGGRAVQCAACGQATSWAKRVRPSSEHLGQKRLFGAYQSNAKRRCITFDLGYEQALALFLGDCHYCGTEPMRVTVGKGRSDGPPLNDIDRVDSSLGYSTSNCVSSCPTCNRAKASMPADQFIAWAMRLVAHQNRGVA